MRIRVLQWDKNFIKADEVFCGETEHMLFALKPQSIYPTVSPEGLDEVTITFIKRVQVVQAEDKVIFEHKPKVLKIGSVYTFRAIDMVEWSKDNTGRPFSAIQIMEACNIQYYTLFYRTIKPLIRLGIVDKVGRGIYRFNKQEAIDE